MLEGPLKARNSHHTEHFLSCICKAIIVSEATTSVLSVVGTVATQILCKHSANIGQPAFSINANVVTESCQRSLAQHTSRDKHVGRGQLRTLKFGGRFLSLEYCCGLLRFWWLRKSLAHTSGERESSIDRFVVAIGTRRRIPAAHANEEILSFVRGLPRHLCRRRRCLADTD
jgi:hypothetical protein